MVIWALAAVLSVEASQALGYADHLYKAGEYYRAAGEYHRVLYTWPTGPAAERARWGLGRAYLRGGKYEEAVRTLSAMPDQAAIAPYARFTLGQAHLALGGFETAGGLFTSLSGDLVPPARLALGAIAAEAGNWEAARIKLSAAGEAELAAVAAAERDRKPVSPTLAGALAIVPGAGHAYLGRHDDALSALLLPTGTALIAAYYLGRRDAVLGYGFASLATVFWGGGIYGAAREAVRLNEQAPASARRRLREAALGQDPTPP